MSAAYKQLESLIMVIANNATTEMLCSSIQDNNVCRGVECAHCPFHTDTGNPKKAIEALNKVLPQLEG